VFFESVPWAASADEWVSATECEFVSITVFLGAIVEYLGIENFTYKIPTMDE